MECVEGIAWSSNTTDLLPAIYSQWSLLWQPAMLQQDEMQKEMLSFRECLWTVIEKEIVVHRQIAQSFFGENVTWSGLAELELWGLPLSDALKNSYQELNLTICIGPAPSAFQHTVIAHSLLYFASALPRGTNTSHFSEQSWSWENEAYCYLSLRGKRCLEVS